MKLQLLLFASDASAARDSILYWLEESRILLQMWSDAGIEVPMPTSLRLHYIDQGAPHRYRPDITGAPQGSGGQGGQGQPFQQGVMNGGYGGPPPQQQAIYKWSCAKLETRSFPTEYFLFEPRRQGRKCRYLPSISASAWCLSHFLAGWCTFFLRLTDWYYLLKMMSNE